MSFDLASPAAETPCPECSSVATVLYGNREPAYFRCNDCGHVWDHEEPSETSPETEHV